MTTHYVCPHCRPPRRGNVPTDIDHCQHCRDRVTAPCPACNCPACKDPEVAAMLAEFREEHPEMADATAF